MKKFTFCILLATMSWFATTNAYAKKNSGPTPEEKGLAQINQANAEAFVRFLAPMMTISSLFFPSIFASTLRM